MVLIKNSAKALAPAALCLVATTGMTGGRSPLRVFGPLRGTSAGTVGRLGGGVEVRVVPTVEGGVVSGAAVVCGALLVGSDGVPDDDVQAQAVTAARHAATNVAIVALARTSS